MVKRVGLRRARRARLILVGVLVADGGDLVETVPRQLGRGWSHGRAPEHRPEHRFLGIEIAVERPLHDARALGDLIELGGGEPLLRKHVQGRVDDLGWPGFLSPGPLRFVVGHGSRLGK